VVGNASRAAAKQAAMIHVRRLVRHMLWVSFGGRSFNASIIKAAFSIVVKAQPRAIAHLVEFSLCSDRNGFATQVKCVKP
jgi:hypothetical protein